MLSDEVVSISSVKDFVTANEFYQKGFNCFRYLDAIIAVEYRVNSYQMPQFRIWATNGLKEFLIKRFVLDDERLKQCKRFEELLERIHTIRASERRFYQKIIDLYAKAPITRQFYKTVIG